MILAASHGAGVRLFPSFNVVYLLIDVKLGLVVGMTKQMSDEKEVDSELLTLKNHDDLTLIY